MQVQAEARAPPAERAQFGGKNAIHIGVAFEDRAEAILDDDGEAHIGPRAFQNLQRGSGENAIA
jgi:hypothetical protein